MDQSNYTITDPNAIEAESFRIITRELGHLGLPEELAAIVKRVIHTTADFEYGRITEIHPGAVASARKALLDGCDIYCDTRMIEAGVNKRRLKELNCNIYTYIDHEEVITKSKELKLTRSILGIDKAAENERTKIFVIGNAPTALVRIGELIDEGKLNPALVIGVPVGFVGAAESKEFIKARPVPTIVTNGRKGGSTVAVSILNALLYMK